MHCGSTPKLILIQKITTLLSHCLKKFWSWAQTPCSSNPWHYSAQPIILMVSLHATNTTFLNIVFQKWPLGQKVIALFCPCRDFLHSLTFFAYLSLVCSNLSEQAISFYLTRPTHVEKKFTRRSHWWKKCAPLMAERKIEGITQFKYFL